MRRRFFLFLLLILLSAGGLFYLNEEKRESATELTLYGNVDVRQVELGFRVKGRVQTLFFEEGDSVKAGDLMAELDPQIYVDEEKRSRAAVRSTQASLWSANKTLQRRRSLVGDGGISTQEYQDAIASKAIAVANLKEALAALDHAKTNLKDTHLFAPSDGIILTRIREPGTAVLETEPVYTLSLPSPVWVRAYVSERELGLVYEGMSAKIYTDTPGGKVYDGHVGFISPVSEFTPKSVETSQLRTDLVYRLRVIADNHDLGLRQGMPVTVVLSLKGDKSE